MSKISRRQFLKGTAVGAVGLTSMSLLSACAAKETPSASEPTPAAVEEKKVISFTPGTYEGTAEGKKGIVKVNVTFSASTIDEIEITEIHETEDLSYIPAVMLPKMIVASQSLAADTVSGATLTSLAIKKAVADAAEKAGADSKLLYDVPVEYGDTAQNMKPGTYVGEAYGCWKKGSIEGERHGTPKTILPTQVQVTVDKDKILSVEVLDCSDTPGFKDPAVDKLPGEIVKYQSVMVDTVTGATMTSAAVLSGALKALEQAGANYIGLTTKTVHEPKDETYDVDFCVVGAGLCGTMASLRASSLGMKTVVIEKTNRISGCGACATGLFAVDTKFSRAMENYECTMDTEYARMMKAAKWTIDAALGNNVLKNSGRIVDWIQEKWEACGQKGFTGPANTKRINHDFGKGTAKFQALWDNYTLPSGFVTLLEDTEMKTIVVEDGKCKGVTAEKHDGSKITVNAKAVLVCTGGFGGNPAMMEKYLGSANFGLVGLSSSVGGGINAGLEAGAGLGPNIAPHLAEFVNNDVIDYYAGYMKFTNQCGYLMVDGAGDRIMNEELMITDANMTGAAAQRRPGVTWLIYTQDNLDKMVEKGVWGVLPEAYIKEKITRPRVTVPAWFTLYDEMEDAISHKQAFKADSLEELGKLAGLDEQTFTQTIADYKECISNGKDSLFGKPAVLLQSLDNGPFYAVRCISPIDGTFSGIKVNKHMQAMTHDNQIIDGLYYGGTDAGGFFSYPYDFGGGTCGFSTFSGFLSAEYAKEYIDKL